MGILSVISIILRQLVKYCSFYNIVWKYYIIPFNCYKFIFCKSWTPLNLSKQSWHRHFYWCVICVIHQQNVELVLSEDRVVFHKQIWAKKMTPIHVRWTEHLVRCVTEDAIFGTTWLWIYDLCRNIHISHTIQCWKKQDSKTHLLR